MEYRNGPNGELIEIPPDHLDCGHPLERNVIVGWRSRDGEVGQRMRTYECRTCGTVTWQD